MPPSQAPNIISTDSLEPILFRVAELAVATQSMEELYDALHKLIASLMYAENFFIALHDETSDSLSMPYFVDTKELAPPPQLARKHYLKTLTGHVLSTGEPLHLNRSEIIAMCEKETLKFGGELCVDWLGVPLKLGDTVFGVMVVQSYREEYTYSGPDKHVLIFVGQHIAQAVARQRAIDALKNAHAELEVRVQERTQELSAQFKISERQKQVQEALYRIADLTHSTDDLNRFYEEIHEITGQLIYAKNFYIAIADYETRMLIFPYRVDEYEEEARGDRPLDLENSKGLTEQILRSKKALLLKADEMENANSYGHHANAWIGVPLLGQDNNAIGVLAVQSHDPKVSYTDDDKYLLSFISQHISTALLRKRSAEKLAAAQEALVEAAHQAGMSEIATDILHNIGNIVNSIATSASELHRLGDRSKIGALEKVNALLRENESKLSEFLSNDSKGQKVPSFINSLTGNLVKEKENAQEQVKNISKCAETLSEVIAAQQKHVKCSSLNQEFEVTTLLDDAVATQSKTLEKYAVVLVKVYSETPAITAQKAKAMNVLINVIKNAAEAMCEVKPEKRRLQLKVNYDNKNKKVSVVIQDGGVGISSTDMSRIFNHGFTTKKSGQGFGLHSCSNSMREMGGDLTASSEGVGMGATFTLSFPTSK